MDVRYPVETIFFVEIAYTYRSERMIWTTAIESTSADSAKKTARAKFARTHMEDAEITGARLY